MQEQEPFFTSIQQREGGQQREPKRNDVIVKGRQTLDRGVLGSAAPGGDLSPAVGGYFRTFWFRVDAS